MNTDRYKWVRIGVLPLKRQHSDSTLSWSKIATFFAHLFIAFLFCFALFCLRFGFISILIRYITMVNIHCVAYTHLTNVSKNFIHQKTPTNMCHPIFRVILLCLDIWILSKCVFCCFYSLNFFSMAASSGKWLLTNLPILSYGHHQRYPTVDTRLKIAGSTIHHTHWYVVR